MSALVAIAKKGQKALDSNGGEGSINLMWDQEQALPLPGFLAESSGF